MDSLWLGLHTRPPLSHMVDLDVTLSRGHPTMKPRHRRRRALSIPAHRFVRLSTGEYRIRPHLSSVNREDCTSRNDPYPHDERCTPSRPRAPVAAWIIFVPAIILFNACSYTQIDNLRVQTNAGAGCSVERGKAVQAEGQAAADADIITQSGQGGGQGVLTELLSSVVDCQPVSE